MAERNNNRKKSNKTYDCWKPFKPLTVPVSCFRAAARDIPTTKSRKRGRRNGILTHDFDIDGLLTGTKAILNLSGGWRKCKSVVTRQPK